MKTISSAELNKRISSGEVVNIIDVREAAEFRSRKIPNSMNFPLGLLEFRMNELDKNKEYIVVCQSGGRSSQAVKFLEYHGFHVTNMNGGMNSWEGKEE
ncbi:rhodanese-like domain-containing protein (plasmid) [Cytobacillus spongiae]|uniref:rhodanese-like domain-containing protein n=1 Tax=Cytobacillus spongiae TaxID=2901381 RepID=UPI001CD1A8B6|nr:rhodanese-like domain-containing protein [Cytobacillus spongiae]MCA1062853.1 rhodanese-like domain-containing protein [Rossellomorea aquimaris]UII58462.1 rhodanese-like domain-containing protein [Cytobacillus spongiae]WJV28511.1 rhodanese-like domain-containing protein [Rossellomorea sp. AcN35-11]